MSEIEVNIPLLRKAVEWAEAEAAKPNGQWNQEVWVRTPEEAISEGVDEEAAHACGTCYCIAGWVAQSIDARFSSKECIEVGGEYKWADEIAADALGVTKEQKMFLFSSSNSIEDVRRIAESIAGERL